MFCGAGTIFRLVTFDELISTVSRQSFHSQKEEFMSRVLDKHELDVLPRLELQTIDAYWRAANYLSVGQIYLYDNPLLKKPLSKEHVKPRLLGHWGTTPGLNFLYVHLNRL